MKLNHVNQWPTHANERRALPRYRFYAHIEMILESKVRWGRVCDVSEEGMFIETSEYLAVNTLFRGRLALETPLPMECVVRRIVPGRGIGVVISFLHEAEKVRFNALLRALGNEADPGASDANIASPHETVFSIPPSAVPGI
jgi:PilZ domain